MQPGADLLADTADQAELRALARGVAERDLAPQAAHWDETEQFPAKSWEALRRAGLFAVTIGEAYGGAGLGDVESAIVLEELARADVASALLVQLTLNGPPRAVEHLGDDPLKRRWLPRAASGETLFCLGITEPEAGSAVPLMRARLERDGDGYRLTAYKNYVTQGHRAGACLVWCRFPGGEGSTGIGAVVVDTAAAGVSVAGLHKKMGMRGTAEAELAFDGVRVEPADVLLAGEPGDPSAFRTLLAHLNHERCGNAAMCVGAAQGALEYATAYLRQRTYAGRPLADLQGLRWKLAEAAVELEAARLLLYRAVALAPPGGSPPAMETAMAKTKANLAAKHVCDEAIQCLGGYGYSREYPVERVYRDVRGLAIGGGTVEMLRNYVGAALASGGRPQGPAWRPAR